MGLMSIRRKMLMSGGKKVVDTSPIAVFTLETSKLPDCYAYIVDTGQILFAGKNSPYYGYTNINDMPT